ncbi:hypothetical protein BCR32DRAFT_264126 [Anaeromyces robustus]|jgi:hypothetical protein|uniref:Coth-domain-containing protein n=1 Tax=Anaeromyces robustus TaxID=1754192 RepID=A0A1Y1XPN0_9FUNG|nr:hypothetical protein BCR32DRAFT_264126 [Anaeromyces robustus]|eukprot:ORX87708.1 hypothetical protein BCR32DRAFT_264126 [Anaeromyces robustus]
MQFKKSISIILATAQALLINAEKVTFKVIAVSATGNAEPAVVIDGTPYAMQIDEYPVYKVQVDVPQLPVEYKYILNDNGVSTEEQFTRTRTEKKGLNDFFNRSQTVIDHPQLPRAYPQFSTYVPSKLYDDTHVATIIITCDPTQLQALHASTEAEDKVVIPAEVIYANPYTVRKFPRARLGLSGQSTRHVPKLSYKIKDLQTDENKELFNRSTVKLRAEHMDPVFLRDKIYGDILNSLGVPAAQNKFVRLFINGEPYGLFNLSDDIGSGRYLRETFNKGEKTTENIPIFKADYCPDCGGYGDLGYHSEDMTNPFYGMYSYKGDDTTMDSSTHFANELFPLIKEIQNYAQGGEMSLDIDTFLKYMALEYLGGGVDNYWNRPGNYYILRAFNSKVWYFHDADFHYTFGCGGEGEAIISSTLANYPPQAPVSVAAGAVGGTEAGAGAGADDGTEAGLKRRLNGAGADDGAGAGDDAGTGGAGGAGGAAAGPTPVTVDKARPPLDAILSRPENKNKFNEIFVRLLETAYHPDALFPRIQSLATLIREDAQWDFTLPKHNPTPDEGESYIFDANEFENNLNDVPTMDRASGYSMTYFINRRIESLTKELGVQPVLKSDLGFVENPSQAKDDKNKDSSDAKDVLSWSIFSTLLVVFVTMMMF